MNTGEYEKKVAKVDLSRRFRYEGNIAASSLRSVHEEVPGCPEPGQHHTVHSERADRPPHHIMVSRAINDAERRARKFEHEEMGKGKAEIAVVTAQRCRNVSSDCDYACRMQYV
ncbi:unnamed protein product [Haemonchus placei]|uniref:Uncharacterized protein n=1 Tax=Haemonchus placei TaxID=6290 RepID=A0A0N4W966_HAEPC|nr:unnamed protein product [Haemonchus placei]